jgi:hypothetical protein
MTESVAFGVIVAGLAVAAPLAATLSRRGRAGAALAIGAGFAGLAVQLLCSRRPDVVAPWLAGTDLALLYPAAGLVAATTVLAALAVRTDARNRRAVLLLCAVLAGYGLFQAAGLLADPGAALGGGGHWKGDCSIQSTGWSCAPSSSVSLLRALGIEAGEAEISRLMRSRPRYGTDALHIQRGLERKLAGTRWRAETRALDYDGLVAARAPGIATMRLAFLLDHAVAVLAADAQGVDVLDPLSGRSRVPRAEFEARWLGEVVLVRPAAGEAS